MTLVGSGHRLAWRPSGRTVGTPWTPRPSSRARRLPKGHPARRCILGDACTWPRGLTPRGVETPVNLAWSSRRDTPRSPPWPSPTICVSHEPLPRPTRSAAIPGPSAPGRRICVAASGSCGTITRYGSGYTRASGLTSSRPSGHGAPTCAYAGVPPRAGRGSLESRSRLTSSSLGWIVRYGPRNDSPSSADAETSCRLSLRIGPGPPRQGSDHGSPRVSQLPPPAAPAPRQAGPWRQRRAGRDPARDQHGGAALPLLQERVDDQSDGSGADAGAVRDGRLSVCHLPPPVRLRQPGRCIGLAGRRLTVRVPGPSAPARPRRAGCGAWSSPDTPRTGETRRRQASRDARARRRLRPRAPSSAAPW